MGQPFVQPPKAVNPFELKMTIGTGIISNLGPHLLYVTMNKPVSSLDLFEFEHKILGAKFHRLYFLRINMGPSIFTCGTHDLKQGWLPPRTL